MIYLLNKNCLPCNRLPVVLEPFSSSSTIVLHTVHLNYNELLIVLVCWGYCNKVPQTESHEQQKFIVHFGS